MKSAVILVGFEPTTLHHSGIKITLFACYSRLEWAMTFEWCYNWKTAYFPPSPIPIPTPPPLYPKLLSYIEWMCNSDACHSMGSRKVFIKDKETTTGCHESRTLAYWAPTAPRNSSLLWRNQTTWKQFGFFWVGRENMLHPQLFPCWSFLVLDYYIKLYPLYWPPSLMKRARIGLESCTARTRVHQKMAVNDVMCRL